MECPYFKTRKPDSFIDRIYIRFQKFWYIYDYRMIVMKSLAGLFACLSCLILYIEAAYFLDRFDDSFLQKLLIDYQLERNFLF